MKAIKQTVKQTKHIVINDKNDMLQQIFGYASGKQTRANHKQLTSK